MKLPFFSRARKTRWVRMHVDKMYFEAHSNRYYLILKAAGRKGGESVFLTLGHLMDESLVPQMVGQGDQSFGLLGRLGLKVRNIRVVKKVNAPDSALIRLGKGLFSLNARVSTIEAVRLALETTHFIDVPEELLKADQFNLQQTLDSIEWAHSSIFSPKFVERDFYSGQEVVM